MIIFNGKALNTVTFPNGEVTVKLDPLTIKVENEVFWKFESNSDFLLLNLLESAIEHSKPEWVDRSVTCHVLYMPYSRMDRSENGSPFSLKAAIEMLPKLFDYIIYEPHSDVVKSVNATLPYLCKTAVKSVRFAYYTPFLLDQMYKRIEDKLKAESDMKTPIYLVFPDEGAYLRYYESDILNVESPHVLFDKIVIAKKVRDFDSGRITSLEFDYQPKSNSNKFIAIIVDDLSSYGGTFILAAKKLKELGAKEVNLVVGHAEDSAFKGRLTDEINLLYTTNSMNDASFAGIGNTTIFSAIDLIKRHETKLEEL